MTSLATFAHTNPAPTPLTGSAIAFAATIVPVLFLAVTLQGRQWQAMLREAASAGRSARENGNLAILIAAHVPIAFAYLVLFAGLFGVGMSIGALAGNSDDPMRHDIVLAAVTHPQLRRRRRAPDSVERDPAGHLVISTPGE